MRADVSSYWSSIVFYKTAVGMNSEGFFLFVFWEGKHAVSLWMILVKELYL